MTAVPLTDRRSDYVSAVAVELADLAPDDRAELIEELDDHIASLLEDRPEADLVAELGSPRVYAQELRTAAGLVADPAVRPSFAARWGDLGRQLDTSLPWLRPLGRFLRPAWWVARGVVVGAAVGLPLGLGYPSGGAYVLIALGVLASLWVAQRAPATPGWRLATRIVNVGAVLLTLYVLSVITAYRVAPADDGFIQTCTDVTNLQPYDSSGRPLTDVRLVDQNGHPFDLEGLGCGNYDARLDRSRPGLFPYPTLSEFDEPTGPPASLAPLPGATVSPSGSSSPSPTPSPSGTR